ncbi:hypothetical protein GIX81_03730 [Lactobacillus reuteri]|uniref:Uncharacterized protein n=1 Tax=Limosilactobacillus reuteri TaxID=1598 RepID=A0A6L5P2Q4_LIMRT|nr:hypothetical protein [Limosilactobacillus reuteri]MRH08571.1 hypothetical protein [Limosilactobacillus reuteri]
MAFEVPHKHDISLDGQEMRNQMIENFEAIEQVINDIYREIDKMKKQDQDNRNFFDDIYHQNEKKDKEG